LGLTICRRFAELLGGNVTVESVVGQGSRFSVFVDVGREVGAMVEALSESGLDLTPADHVNPTSQSELEAPSSRILLVEDGEDNQRLISTFLRSGGYCVDLAVNGAEGLEKAMAASQSGRAYDVILMDMQMPVMDGYAAIQQLRVRGYQGHVIALTAHAMAEDRQRCLNAGCDDYLSKPIDKVRLLEKCAAAVRPKIDEAESSRLLSELADDPDVASLLPRFLDSLEPLMSDLETELDRQAFDALSDLAHQIKGTGGSYGYPSITVAAHALEQVIRADDSADTIKLAVVRLNAICRAAVAGGAALDRAETSIDADADQSSHAA